MLRFWEGYARELSDDAYGTYNFNWGYYLAQSGTNGSAFLTILGLNILRADPDSPLCDRRYPVSAPEGGE